MSASENQPSATRATSMTGMRQKVIFPRLFMKPISLPGSWLLAMVLSGVSFAPPSGWGAETIPLASLDLVVESLRKPAQVWTLRSGQSVACRLGTLTLVAVAGGRI
jgi:uncharacterized membrane protein